MSDVGIAVLDMLKINNKSANIPDVIEAHWLVTCSAVVGVLAPNLLHF